MIQALAMACLFVVTVLPVWAQDISLVEAVRVKEGLTFCGEIVPLELPQVRQRFEKEMLLALGDSPQALLWIKRAPQYMPIIEESLRTFRYKCTATSF